VGAEVFAATVGRGEGGGVGFFVDDGVEEDGGKGVVLALGDGDADVGVGRLVDLGRPTDSADWLIAGLEEAGGDEFVEVEGGEFAGDADRCRRLVPGDRAVGSPDEVVHAAPQVVVERGDSPDVRIGHLCTVTPILVSETPALDCASQ
jgi:hypothetical protein